MGIMVYSLFWVMQELSYTINRITTQKCDWQLRQPTVTANHQTCGGSRPGKCYTQKYEDPTTLMLKKSRNGVFWEEENA